VHTWGDSGVILSTEVVCHVVGILLYVANFNVYGIVRQNKCQSANNLVKFSDFGVVTYCLFSPIWRCVVLLLFQWVISTGKYSNHTVQPILCSPGGRMWITEW